MNTDTTKDQAPVYGIRLQKPGMYLGLFHGCDTSKETMNDWGFDGPALGPLKHVHTTYASNVHVQFNCLSDAHMLTGNNDTYLELQLDGGLLCFDGKFYGDWTVYMVSPEECLRPPTPSGKTPAPTICADKHAPSQ